MPLTQDFLYEEYVNKNRTYQSIGDEVGLSPETVLYWMRKFDIKARSAGFQLKDITGQVFGKLTVLEKVPGKGWSVWWCLCECGQKTKVKSNELINKGQTQCRLCRNKLVSERQWKGFGEISGEYWNSIIRHAKHRKKEFCLKIEYGWDLFLKQDRKCAISGLPIYFIRSRYSAGKGGTASLDRIDSSIGYVEGNVQWVHKDINKMKWNFTQEKFINYCLEIINYQGLQGVIKQPNQTKTYSPAPIFN